MVTNQLQDIRKFQQLFGTETIVMNEYVDCGMHLVFHGVVAYCVEVLESFTSDHNLTPFFQDLVNDYLSELESLRLEW